MDHTNELTINHPIFLRARLSHLVRCAARLHTVINVPTASTRRVLACESILICVTKRDIQTPACSQYTPPLAIIRVAWTALGLGITTHPELRPRYRYAMPQTYAKVSWSDSFSNIPLKPRHCWWKKIYTALGKKGNVMRDKSFSLSKSAFTYLRWYALFGVLRVIWHFVGSSLTDPGNPECKQTFPTF